MSRIVETKVKIGVEATGGDRAQSYIGNVAKGVKNAQQAFIGLEQIEAMGLNRTAANAAKTALSDFMTAVSTPSSQHGMG